jgi:hypothetical protein
MDEQESDAFQGVIADLRAMIDLIPIGLTQEIYGWKAPLAVGACNQIKGQT